MDGLFQRIHREVGAQVVGDAPPPTIRRDQASIIKRNRVTHDKPMELGALNGAVVKRGREHGVEVPMNEAVQALLSPWAERNARS